MQNEKQKTTIIKMLFELCALALACFEFVQSQILVEEVSTLRPPRPNEEYFRTFKFSSTTRPTQPKADPDEFFFGWYLLNEFLVDKDKLLLFISTRILSIMVGCVSLPHRLMSANLAHWDVMLVGRMHESAQ